jgi:hypothetical protein
MGTDPETNATSARTLNLRELERFTSFEPDPFDAITFAWFGHVPQIDVTAVERLAFSFGIVTSMTFDEWLTLEGLNAWDWESYYGPQQTFAGASIREEQSSDDLPLRAMIGQGGEAAIKFWLLATTTFDIFAVHPNVSSGYSSCRGKDRRLRVMRARGIGELECLRLPARITVQPAHTDTLGRNSALIDAVWDSELASVLNAFTMVFSRTIAYAGLPEVWLDFVGQLELFLNPRGERPLGRTFSDRFASLCALTPDELPAYREIGKAMYDFRSKTLHGARPDVNKAATAIGRHYPFPSTILRRCIELMAHVSGGATASVSPQQLLSGDRGFLTDAYLAQAPARLGTIAPPEGVTGAVDDLNLVDEELSLPPFTGPDAEERAKALLASLGARMVRHDD